jgi:hypothetical protein
VISSFSSFAKSLPLLYRSPDGEPARIADEPVGVYWVVLMVGTVGKGDPVVVIPDTCSLLPYARANEVAKAARNTTSVAAIEPPVPAPHVCDPVTDPATSALSWITTPPSHRAPLASRYTWHAGLGHQKST